MRRADDLAHLGLRITMKFPRSYICARYTPKVLNITYRIVLFCRLDNYILCVHILAHITSVYILKAKP